MLSLRLPGAALVLALAAGMTLAQSGGADPPSAGTVPGTGETRKPQPVMTLEQKKKLVIFCQQAANRKDARCAALKDSLPISTEVPDS
jgi:type IV pilus biogenesis protein CpaD/CtpE